MDRNINLPNNEILTNLSKSSISDLEFEVAQMRSSYPPQIEKLHRAIIAEHVQSVKKQFLSNPSDITAKDQSAVCAIPMESEKPCLNVSEDVFDQIHQELKKYQALHEECTKLNSWLNVGN